MVLVKKLDRPVKQVLIEARIVTVERNALEELGVRFGVTDPRHISGTLQGASAMAAGAASADVPFLQRLNVNLPATAQALGGNPAAMGIALAKLGGGVLLDLELSALQTENRAKIIASPRLVTADQKEAVIETGEEIPYQEATSSGATAVSFKKAVLSLRVTPQITPNHRVILNLAVNQDTRGPEVLLGVPAINTREINTQVLINNGQTIVLGGVYQKTSRNHLERVPFLSEIPFLGYLFKHRFQQEQLNELLIFVTPKIVKQAMY